MHYTVVLTQGIVAPAILMGAIVWAMVDFSTPSGRSIEDLLIRIIPAFIIGAFIGDFLGYMFNFGKFVVEPAFNGKLDGMLIIFIVAILIVPMGSGLCGLSVAGHDSSHVL